MMMRKLLYRNDCDYDDDGVSKTKDVDDSDDGNFRSKGDDEDG